MFTSVSLVCHCYCSNSLTPSKCWPTLNSGSGTILIQSVSPVKSQTVSELINYGRESAAHASRGIERPQEPISRTAWKN